MEEDKRFGGLILCVLCVHFLGECCCPSQLKHCAISYPPTLDLFFFQGIPICIMSGLIHFMFMKVNGG